MTLSVGDALIQRIAGKTATVGIIGLGYVGLPLAIEVCRSGYRAVGFDTDERRNAELRAHHSYIEAVPNEALAEFIGAKRLGATSDEKSLGECDVVIVCVPTPLDENRGPDLGHVLAASHAIARNMKRGALVVIESTVQPGATVDFVKPILDATGLRCGEDYFLAYSPERVDPGNQKHRTHSIPKLFAGVEAESTRVGLALYSRVFGRVIPVSSTGVAEAAKLTENVFRAVNIALVNDLKIAFDAIGIDVWEVIEAASTKPFGFMPFFPGPGLGGHCIPVDPIYLQWSARAAGAPSKLIDAASEVNDRMPHHVVERLGAELAATRRKDLKGAKILVIGMAYKPNISDVRESPGLEILDLLRRAGASPLFHDPLVDSLRPPWATDRDAAMRSSPLTAQSAADVDAALIVTDHDAIDYALLSKHARLIVDTRNAMRKRGLPTKNVRMA